MKRSALALLGLLALPLAAAAQHDRPLLTTDEPSDILPTSRFSITPYIAARVPFTTGDAVLIDSAGRQSVMRWDRGGGPMAGVDFTAQLHGPVHFIGGAAFSPHRTDVVRVAGDAGSDSAQADGANVWFAKAGVQVRLAEPTPDDRHFHPSALVTVAPALIWTDFPEIQGFPDAANKTGMHFGLNLGVDAAARIGHSNVWSYLIGVQDYLAFWNTDDLTARDASIGATLLQGPVAIDYGYSTSNMFVLRFGVSYRFR